MVVPCILSLKWQTGIVIVYVVRVSCVVSGYIFIYGGILWKGM